MIEIISLLFAHFLGDWFLQSRTIALNKSKNFNYMVLHMMLVAGPIYLVAISYDVPVMVAWLFSFIYSCIHGIQDFLIWRIVPIILKVKVEYWEDKKFYDLIAVDQFLHLSVLFILWEVFHGML
jgi:hypothetical protein